MLIFFQTLLILSVFWRTGFSRSTAHSLVVPWRHFPADPHFRAAWLQHVQQLFKSLTKGAEYLLCLETVKNPKTLPCLHSFCLECLDELANVARTKLQTTINCLPFARLPFQFPTQIPSPIGLHCFISTNWQCSRSWKRHLSGSEMQHWWLSRTTQKHVTVLFARVQLFKARLSQSWIRGNFIVIYLPLKKDFSQD